MKRLAFATAIALSLPLTALAHSPLKSTYPADKAVMKTLPDRLALEFGKPARLTKITLTHTLGDTSQADRLDLPSKQFETQFTFTPNFRGDGDYTVEWRALSNDGHPLKGAFSFSVSE